MRADSDMRTTGVLSHISEPPYGVLDGFSTAASDI
jgi:hypothetical protein